MDHSMGEYIQHVSPSCTAEIVVLPTVRNRFQMKYSNDFLAPRSVHTRKNFKKEKEKTKPI